MKPDTAQPGPHPDDEAVDRFAVAMKEKMTSARAKGRGGWETADPAHLSRLLRDHIAKGDPRDVANFCMMLHQTGNGIVAQPSPVDGRWYIASREGLMTLCASKSDAEREAASADQLFPRGAPHIVLQIATLDHSGGANKMVAVGMPWVEPLSAERDQADGYIQAFYEIAKLLDIGARAESPKWVFENVMLPKLKALLP